jgi:hypothetical protein
MQKIILFLSIFISSFVYAQVPEDAVRYTWFTQNGSARNLAIGGAMGSLGGDVTANFVNPAGIGFYKTNEVAFSSGLLMNKIKTEFRNSITNENKNAFGLGTSGFVMAMPNQYDHKKSNTFSIGFTQAANFNNLVHYKGLNNRSSFSEQFVEEFLNSKQSIDNILDTKSTLPYTAAPALYTYLIDTVRVAGTLIVKAAPEYIVRDLGQALQQEMTKTTKGGMYELAVSYAGNDGEKWLWGVSAGVPIINFESNTNFKENDTSSSTTNHFKSFTFNDNYTTQGLGINAKIGLIYRPKEYIRVGLAVHTPTFMSLKDSRQSTLMTELENPIGSFNASSDLFTDGKRGEAKYLQTSPWKVILSGSYVFREVEDVTRQRGFISADIEYVKHNGTKFSSDADKPTEDQKVYYKGLNNVIKDNYKGNINARIGAEIKFNTIMGRVGFGYYGSPYKSAPINASKMTFSGGLGYRNKGFFVDLTYVHLVTKDFDIPYRIQDPVIEHGDINKTTGNVVATIGIKF